MTGSRTPAYALLCSGLNVEHAEVEWLTDIGRRIGARVDLISTDRSQVQGYEHLAKTEGLSADRLLVDVDPEEYFGVLVLNGVIGPYEVRMSQPALDFVREFDRAAKPIYAVGHAPWVLIGAGVVEGRRVGAWPNLRADVERVGGIWDHAPVVFDGNLLTGRQHEAILGNAELLLDFLSTTAMRGA